MKNNGGKMIDCEFCAYEYECDDCPNKKYEEDEYEGWELM